MTEEGCHPSLAHFSLLIVRSKFATSGSFGYTLIELAGLPV
jgi:hypothetical protein